MGQPGNSCAWRHLGAAARQFPDAGPCTCGDSRPGACSACHREHPLICRTEAAAPAQRLAGSRHGHPFLEIQDNAEHTAEPVLSASFGGRHAAKRSNCFVLIPHYAQPGSPEAATRCIRTSLPSSRPGTRTACATVWTVRPRSGQGSSPKGATIEQTSDGIGLDHRSRGRLSDRATRDSVTSGNGICPRD